MKKFSLFFFVSLLVSSGVIAQSKAKTKQLDPFSFMISVGSNWSIFTNPQTSGSTFTQAKQVSGFNFGLTGNWPISKAFAVQAGLRLSQKGSRVYADTPYYHVYSTPRPLYLELPVNLVYTYKLSRNTRIYGGVGGYAAKGMGGKNSYSGISGTLGEESLVSGNDKIVYGNPGSTYSQVQTFGNLKKFDFGVGGLLGVEYWKFDFTLGYEEGLSAIAYGANTPNKDSKNRSMSFTLGFHF